MITLRQAKALKPGDILWIKDSDGRDRRWRVNGKVQTWKRDPLRIRIPIKYGLYRYGSIDDTMFVAIDDDGEMEDLWICRDVTLRTE